MFAAFQGLKINEVATPHHHAYAAGTDYLYLGCGLFDSTSV